MCLKSKLFVYIFVEFEKQGIVCDLKNKNLQFQFEQDISEGFAMPSKLMDLNFKALFFYFKTLLLFCF